MQAAVYAFYFLAGIFGLTYEVVWSRILTRELGQADLAHAVVLGTWMGGLALGARLFGQWSDSLRRPLRVYGGLETLTGLYALGAPLLFSLAVDSVTGGWRVAVAVAALLPATVLMGGSFPLLTRYLTSRTVDLRRNVGHLYAVNTAGSVLGGLLAGFWLLDMLSPDTALRATGGCNLALGAFVVFASRDAPHRAEGSAPTADHGQTADAVTYGPSARRMALMLAAFSGIATMALEVAWTQDLAVVLGDSTHGLTLMLAAFLSGSALGAVALASRRAGRFPLPDLVGGALLLTALLLVATRPIYSALPQWLPLSSLAYPLCFAALLLPMAAAGVVFPAAVRLATDERAVGGRVGRIYALNTLGTLLGAVLSGLVLVPTFGSGVVFTGVSLAYAAAGLAVTWSGRAVPRPTVVPLVPVALAPDAREDEAG